MAVLLWPVVTKVGGPILGYTFECPGCHHHHWFATHESQPVVWKFNGDFEKPTFAPSLINKSLGVQQDVCHLFVRDGKIQYLPDCTHELKSTTVDMVDLGEEQKDIG